jgi:hypothetical protein
VVLINPISIQAATTPKPLPVAGRTKICLTMLGVFHKEVTPESWKVNEAMRFFEELFVKW